VGDETDHLVQRKPPVDDEGGGGVLGHEEVHLLVHQPEGDGLVPDQGLVM